MTTTTPGATLTHDAAAGILASLGFTVSTTSRYTQALGVFQAGWNLGPALSIDEILGPKTSAALTLSEAHRRANQPTASAHFSFTEFACHCHGSCGGCVGVLVARPLLVGLEALRAAHYPHGLAVASGYRCPGWNAKTPGAAKDSQHQYGAACDIAKVVDRDVVERMGVFSGIGYGSRSKLVRHVDVRGVAAGTGAKAHLFTPPNTTGSTRAHPTTWVYEND